VIGYTITKVSFTTTNQVSPALIVSKILSSTDLLIYIFFPETAETCSLNVILGCRSNITQLALSDGAIELMSGAVASAI